MSTDIELAREAWGLTPWSECEAEGRPLRATDADTLAGLGADDPTFVWERKEEPVEYFKNLLNFRLDHYNRHGFGVHAVESNGSLVGQCGLQVLDYERDQVEFAIFLSASVRGRGLGRCLSSFIVDRCREAGMSRLYGVVRADNPEGSAMVARLGGMQELVIHHFGLQAVRYVINLKGEL